ncbi:MAG: beta-propeller fold lactonase family protein [Terriglobales bacterium]
MSKKITGVVALVGMCALSIFLLNCGSSSSRPSGLLYVLTQGVNGGPNNISSFSMNLNNGALSLINFNATTCVTSGACGSPLDIVLDPTGANAFVLNQGIPCIVQLDGKCVPSNNAPIAPSIYSFTANSDGSLSAAGAPVNWTCVMPNGTACTYYPDTATAMVMDAGGQFLFVIDQGVFPRLTTCPGVAGPVTNGPQASAYTGCPSISVFAIKGTTLTLVSQSLTYQSPLFLSKLPSALSVITFTPPGGSLQELLFVTNNQDICVAPGCIPPSPNNDNTLSVYAVSSTGQLSEQPNSPYSLAAPNPISVMAVNTNPPGQNAGGVFVFVGNQGSQTGAVNPFQLCTVQNANCTQTEVQQNLVVPVTCAPANSCAVGAGTYPVGMVVDPTNNFLYVISELSSTVYAFRINTQQGTLAGLSPPNLQTGTQPVSIALHPSVNNTGQFLYVSNSNSDNISGYSLVTTTGTMSSLQPTITPAAPSGIAAH